MTGGERRLTIAALSAVSLALCILIAAEISGGRSAGAAFPAEGRRDHAAAPLAPADEHGEPDRHAAWLAEILARPLFSPNRRPSETGVAGLPRLTGIVVAGTQRAAIFAAPANGHPIVAEAGGHVGAYEVQSITDAGVTVLGPGGTTLIKPLFDTSRPPGPGQPTAPASRLPLPRPATK